MFVKNISLLNKKGYI